MTKEKEEDVINSITKDGSFSTAIDESSIKKLDKAILQKATSSLPDLINGQTIMADGVNVLLPPSKGYYDTLVASSSVSTKIKLCLEATDDEFVPAFSKGDVYYNKKTDTYYVYDGIVWHLCKNGSQFKLEIETLSIDSYPKSITQRNSEEVENI